MRLSYKTHESGGNESVREVETRQTAGTVTAEHTVGVMKDNVALTEQ